MPMLTELDLDKLKSWKYKVIDESLLSRVLQPVWNYQVTFFPQNVHPNLISLAGFFCVLYAFVLTQRSDPSLTVAAIVVVLSTLYTFLDALDGKQARRINSSSPIGELFDHALDNLSMVLLLLSLFRLAECTDRFYILAGIFTMSIMFLSFHLDAFLSDDHILVFGTLTGQNEGMTWYNCFVLFPFWRSSKYFPTVVAPLSDFLIKYAPHALIYLTSMYFIIKFIACAKKWWRERAVVPFSEARQLQAVLAIVLTYGVRLVGVLASSDSSTLAYLCEGFVLSIPTTEIILCKMSDKAFSPIVVVLAMASVIDNSLALLCTAGYYSYLFYSLTVKLRIPFLRPKRRVYCCGVFDMCHRGHMLLFQRTAVFGDEVVVGVHNDEDVASYKRKPNVSHEERCATVSCCKFVSEVIPDAPL
jgi:cytidyltransferase-like protein